MKFSVSQISSTAEANVDHELALSLEPNVTREAQDNDNPLLLNFERI